VPETPLVFKAAGINLSATLNMPENPTHMLLLAHGAGADHRHAHMASLAEAFQAQEIATLRFNFPFRQEGRNRVDSKAISTECIIRAAAFLEKQMALPLFIGGHSFGGRMATHAVAEEGLQCSGMVLCSYPLHGVGKPSTDRAAHLKLVTVPMLFLSGTRDKLADRKLLTGEIEKLPSIHKVHWLDTGDHSFKILKRTRTCGIDIYTEAGQVARGFVSSLR